jgi:hypothetical protein
MKGHKKVGLLLTMYIDDGSEGNANENLYIADYLMNNIGTLND